MFTTEIIYFIFSKNQNNNKLIDVICYVDTKDTNSKSKFLY